MTLHQICTWKTTSDHEHQSKQDTCRTVLNICKGVGTSANQKGQAPVTKVPQLQQVLPAASLSSGHGPPRSLWYSNAVREAFEQRSPQYYEDT